jgi:RNA polymerase primary sigma factor
MHATAATGTPLDALSLYLTDLGRRPLLQPWEEVALAKRCEAGDEQAKSRLIEANLRLVVTIAKTHRGVEIPLLDLIQEGTLGLMRAVEGFDWRRGVRFSTYASYWVRESIDRLVAAQAEPMRVPIRLRRRLRALTRAVREIESELGRPPSAAEIAEATAWSVEEVEWLRGLRRNYESFDEAAADGGARLTDVVGDPAAASTFESADNEIGSAWIRKLVAKLPDTERRVIELRFGFNGEPRSVKEIAGAFGLGPQAVRMLEARGLARLRRDGGRALEAERPLRVADRAAGPVVVEPDLPALRAAA